MVAHGLEGSFDSYANTGLKAWRACGGNANLDEGNSPRAEELRLRHYTDCIRDTDARITARSLTGLSFSCGNACSHASSYW